MLNRRLLGLVLMATAALSACSTDTSLGVEGKNAGGDARPATGCRPTTGSSDQGCSDGSSLPTVAAEDGGQICTVGVDQSCNDAPTASDLAGVCVGGTACTCKVGFAVNPASGRCRAVPISDAATAIDAASKDAGPAPLDAPAGTCTVGVDSTCNDSPISAWIAGTCQSDGTCVCRAGYVMNASSGRCMLAPRDAGPDVAPAIDAGTDAKAVCNPAQAWTCNGDPASEAVWGVCQADGTCLCNSGYVLNTSTGKCMRQTTTCSSYDACGCGCCGGTTPQALCYYPSAGDLLSTIQAADEEAKRSPNCAMVGCAAGRRYLCCAEVAAEPAGSASYSATSTVGGYNRITLKKTGTDGNCLSLGLSSPPFTSTRPLRVTTPTNWGVETISLGACSSTSREQAIGAQGTVSLTPGETACTIAAHVTVFFYSAAQGTLTSMRIDASVPITGGGFPGSCQ